MTSLPTTRILTARRIATAGAVGALVLLGAAACGSSAAGSRTVAGGSGPQTAQGGGPGGRFPGGRFPGAVGTVAAVSGSTAQVQSPQVGQVAVSWSGATTFTRQVHATLADVKVGSCVMVLPAGAPGGTGAATPPTAVTAATVRITQPRAGSCSFRGPGAGPQRNGAPSSGPGGGPTGAPGGATARGTFRGFGAFGQVTAVSSGGFTVSSNVAFPGDSGGPRSVAVAVTSGTSYTSTVAGSPTDVKVGRCLQAQGPADDTGAIAATRIEISAPQNGQCSGFGRFQRGGQVTGTAS